MKKTSSLFMKSALATTLAFALFHAENAAASCAESGSAYIGSICYTAASYCPPGYLSANGGILQIRYYQALYALLSNNYGGNAAAGTFALPDLRGRSAIGTGQGTGLSSIALAQTPGAETATLTTLQLPVHTHPVTLVDPANNNVTIAETPGTLSVSASLPVGLTPPASGGAAPLAGLNYLSAISATVGSGLSAQNATFKGPFVQTKPGTGTTLPADTSVTGSPTIPAFSFKVPQPVVGTAGLGQPFSVRDPSIGLTACIVNIGLYPTRE